MLPWGAGVLVNSADTSIQMNLFFRASTPRKKKIIYIYILDLCAGCCLCYHIQNTCQPSADVIWEIFGDLRQMTPQDHKLEQPYQCSWLCHVDPHGHSRIWTLLIALCSWVVILAATGKGLPKWAVLFCRSFPSGKVLQCSQKMAHKAKKKNNGPAWPVQNISQYSIHFCWPTLVITIYIFEIWFKHFF